MDRNEARHDVKANPERVIVVEEAKFTELLVSRRKLERLGPPEGRLHDRETHEIFVVAAPSPARFAKGA